MKIKTATIFTLALIMLSLSGRVEAARPLRANAVVEKNTVFMGEAFIFQIQITGSETPEKPDLSSISDFSVEYRGGQQNSSSSVSIINGQITKRVTKGYVFSYQLIPKRTGRLIIPSITVTGDNQSVKTASIAINVQKPGKSDNFKLRLKLSKTRCYVGEPVTLTITWYLGDDVRGFNMALPLLENEDDFYFIDPEVDTSSGGKFYRIPLAGKDAIGEKGQERLDGKNYATITLKKILIPKKAGDITIEPATVVCEVLSGYRRQQNNFNNDFFSDFFNDNFFGSGRQGVYRKVAVSSNPLDLNISQVPEKGRPKGFAGHIGEYRIEAEAAPLDLSVGDPITLKLTLRGPDYLDHVTLPPLNQQADLARDFKIPRERALGETQGKAKVFTQTIRPLRPGIKEIPSIKLPYFDTRTGGYEIAATKPIPIKVKSTRVVTAMDAEGKAQPALSTSEVETWTRGIAYNYEDMSVIQDQRLGLVSWMKSPVILSMTMIPPIVYLLLLLGSSIMAKLYGDPSAFRARKAHANLKSAMRSARTIQSHEECCDKILDSLRQYLGDKLGIPAGALTFNDVKKILEEKKMDTHTIKQLKLVFDQCEAGRYAGGSAQLSTSPLIAETLNLGKLLEKKL